MFAAPLVTSGTPARVGSPVWATRACRHQSGSSPGKSPGPVSVTTARRVGWTTVVSSSSRGRPQREVAARAQNTTEEKVTVTETSGGSAVSEMPAQDDSIKAKLVKFIDDNSLQLNALLNVLVVGSVSFGTIFQVIEVDADIRTGWTWVEILRNLPADNLAAYQSAVFANPVLTKACTSGVAYTLGDFTCQLSQGKTIGTCDLKRSLRSGVAGFAIHGPLCHLWLIWTEDNLSFANQWWTVPLKVFADQTVWSLFLNSAYTTCIMSLQGMRPGKVKDEIAATWWNAISAGWKFWPFIHTLTFSSIIPQDFKLLWVDCVEVIWVTILSAAVNRDSEKALQVPMNNETERPGSQMQGQLANEFSAEVGGVAFTFDRDFLPSRDSGDSGDFGGSGSGSLDEGGCAWRESCSSDFGEGDAVGEKAR